MGPGGYDLYGKRFLETLTAFWAPDIQLTMFYHDCELPEDAKRFEDRVQFVHLNEYDGDFVAFSAKAKHANGIQSDGTYAFRFDAKKFCAKVFATSMTMTQSEEEWLIWLDADTFTHQPVSTEWLDETLDQSADIVHLGRTGASYSETSFVAFHRPGDKAKVLLQDMRDMYVDGEIFFYTECHDGFVFERLLYMHKAHGMKTQSLTIDGYDGLEAFENSPLVRKMHHLKGNRKNEKDLPLISRYDQLTEIVKHYAHLKDKFVLLETGTNGGTRAIEMANAAFAMGVKEVTYSGFDLFEDATAETDAREFNTKNHFTVEEVTKKLQDYADQVGRNGRKFKFNLVKGDTTKTLGPQEADLAFLDGGHSPETVAWDFAQCSGVDVVVLDDYIVPDKSGDCPGPEHLGTNLLVDSLTCRKTVYESKDMVAKGGITKIAAVLQHPKTKDFPKLGTTVGSMRQLQINPHDCVEQPELIQNVEENLKLIKDWLPTCKPHAREMVIVGGGPNVRKNFEDIRRHQRNGAFIAAVKHAVPFMHEAGIHVDAVVVLDPRPIKGVSTHGVVREELFGMVDLDTRVWVASMTDPTVTKYLIGRGVRVQGWHALTKGLAEWTGWPKEARLIAGGTCSAWRTVGLGNMLGFQTFHIYGLDLCYDPATINVDEKDEQGRPKYLKVSLDEDAIKYHTTGELAAAAQDIKTIMEMATMFGLELYVHGEGLGPDAWRKAYGGLAQKKHNFEKDVV